MLIIFYLKAPPSGALRKKERKKNCIGQAYEILPVFANIWWSEML